MTPFQYRFQSRPNLNFVRPRLFRGAIREIIIINLIVYLTMVLFHADAFFARFFGLVPTDIWQRGYVWQMFTYMFVHANFSHIFWNMFILWMFGMEIENYWGKKRFYQFYFLTGVGSGIITFLFSLHSSIPVVGASGAIYGVLAAFALLFPERKIYFYFLIPIKAKYFVLIMGVITFFSTFGAGTGISHLTHLGGLVIGFVYLKRFDILSWIRKGLPRIRIRNPFKKWFREKQMRTKTEKTEFHYDTDDTLREEVDRILDQINERGYDSLSEDDKRTLFLASQYFAKREKRKN